MGGLFVSIHVLHDELCLDLGCFLQLLLRQKLGAVALQSASCDIFHYILCLMFFTASCHLNQSFSLFIIRNS